jgi:hypothetical protein
MPQGLIHGELKRNGKFLCWLLKQSTVQCGVDTEGYHVKINLDRKIDRYSLSPGDTLTIKAL